MVSMCPHFRSLKSGPGGVTWVHLTGKGPARDPGYDYAFPADPHQRFYAMVSPGAAGDPRINYQSTLRDPPRPHQVPGLFC